jgi:DNA-binding NarL/FixJ family response regulator
VKIAVISPVALFRECIAAGLEGMQPKPELATAPGVAWLTVCPAGEQPDVAVVDVTTGIDLEEIGLVTLKWPDLPLLALGVPEDVGQIVQYGRAGFVGYVSREAQMAMLQEAIRDVASGRLNCPAEIAGGLIRALSSRTEMPLTVPDQALTPRETDVLRILGRGFSNKEIAREMDLSPATIKTHVHHILGKLGVVHRTQAMRWVREAPWVLRSPSSRATPSEPDPRRVWRE